MKKVLVLAALLILPLYAIAQEQESYTYSPSFIKRLQYCSIYSEEYSTTIPTEDVNSPYLKVRSTEEVLGYINNKCYTKSVVYSYDLDKDILKIKCGLTKAQIADAVEKMRRVNDEKTPEAKRALQKEVIKMIENPQICRIKNYLEE